jgi:hypothetical protein
MPFFCSYSSGAWEITLFGRPRDNCPSSGLYGPVRSGQVRFGGVSGECGLVRLTCVLWNDRENDHLPTKLCARTYQQERQHGLDDQAGPGAGLGRGWLLVVHHIILSSPAGSSCFLGIQLQPPVGALAERLAQLLPGEGGRTRCRRWCRGSPGASGPAPGRGCGRARCNAAATVGLLSTAAAVLLATSVAPFTRYAIIAWSTAQRSSIA